MEGKQRQAEECAVRTGEGNDADDQGRESWNDLIGNNL